MDEAWRRARLDELWDTYVVKVQGMEPLKAGEDRAAKAIEMLRMLQIIFAQASEQGNRDQAMLTASRGRVVLQLLSLEFGDWLLDAVGLDRSLMEVDNWEGVERVALKTVLMIHARSGPHPHRPAVDPMPILVP